MSSVVWVWEGGTHSREWMGRVEERTWMDVSTETRICGAVTTTQNTISLCVLGWGQDEEDALSHTVL